MAKDLELKLRITADGQVAVKELGRVDGALGEIGDGGEAAGSKAADGLDQIKRAAAAVGLAALAREFVQVNSAVESQKAALTQLLGSSEAASAEMAYLAQVSDRLGQSVLDLGDQYVGLAAATKGTALEGAATRDVFEAVVGAMAKLGKSSAETTRALAAIQQMASKGVVSAEEMRGQLGEALPGAMQALSRATGVAVQDLNAMMESGQLMAADVLPALAHGLNQTFGDATTTRVETLSASVARLQNALARAFTEPGQSGLSEAFARVIDTTSSAVTGLTAGTVALGRNLGAVAAYVSGAIPSWESLREAIDENNRAGEEYIQGAQPLAQATATQSAALGQLAAASLQAAAAYTTQEQAAAGAVAAATASAAAAVAAAKAQVERARLLQDESALLAAKAEQERASSAAARETAAALQSLAEITSQRIAALEAEIAAIEAHTQAEGGLTAASEAQIASRRAQIDQLAAVAEERRKAASAAADQALAEEAAAQQARIAAATYGDQSAALQGLIAQRERLQAAIRAEGEASAAAAPLLRELAEINVRIADAARDAADAADRQVEAIRGELTVAQGLIDLRREQLALDYQRAEAAGRTAEMSRAQVDLMRAEAEQSRLAAEAKRAEAAALLEKAAAMQVAAQATGEYTAEEQAAVQAARDAAEAARLSGEQIAVMAKAQQEAADRAGALAARLEGLNRILVAAGIEPVQSFEALGAAISGATDTAQLDRFESAVKRAYATGRLAADEYRAALAQITDAQAAVTAATASFINLTGAVRDRYYAMGDAVGKYFDRMMSGVRSIKEWWGVLSDQQFARVEASYQRLQSQADGLTRRLQDGTATAYDMATAQGMIGAAAIGAYHGVIALGEEDLGGLRSALETARAQMDSLTKSAQDGLTALRSEWAGLMGDMEEVERLRGLEKRTALEQQLAEAQRTGNDAAAAALREQLAIQEKITAERLRQAKAKREEADAAKRAQEAPEAAPPPRSQPTDRRDSAPPPSAPPPPTTPVPPQRDTRPVAPVTNNIAPVINIEGVLDVNDRVTLTSLARKLKPILADLERRGA